MTLTARAVPDDNAIALLGKRLSLLSHLVVFEVFIHQEINTFPQRVYMHIQVLCACIIYA